MPLSRLPRPINVRLKPFRFHLSVLLGLAVLGGCGDMSGKYQAADGGGDSIEFQGDRVYITIAPSPTLPGEYEVKGDKVIITVAGQSMALTQRGNTLEGGPFGMTFVRQ